MQIGIGLLEYMSFITLITGVCWLTARVRRKKIEQSGKKPLWVSFGADFFGVVALILFCRIAIADWHQVPSGSMEPAIRVGDKILVNKLAYGPRLPFTNTALPFGSPQRGDVVVFRYPGDVPVLYVKRLIGLPGDVVSYSRGVVSINDQPFQAKLDISVKAKPEDAGQLFVHEIAAGNERTVKLNADRPGAQIAPIAWLQQDKENCVVVSAERWQCRVPHGKYLMMGDNRDNSADSRVWGLLDESQIYGKATRVIANFSDFSRWWTLL